MTPGTTHLIVEGTDFHDHTTVVIDEPEKFTIVNCPVCGSQEQSTDLCELWGTENVSLITAYCARCAHVYYRRLPNPDWYTTFYFSEWDTRGKVAAGRTNMSYKRFLWRSARRMAKTIAWPLRRILRRPISGQRRKGSKVLRFWPGLVSEGPRVDGAPKYAQDVLEIGCGTGDELSELKRAGLNTHGIEHSTHRAELAQQKAGGPILNIPVENLDTHSFGKDFDFVFAHHVLEHVFDPNDLLQAVKKVLKTKGFLYLAVPNVYNIFLFHLFQFAPHTNNFTPESLTLLLEKHGFVVEQIAVDFEIQILARRREYHPQPDYYGFPHYSGDIARVLEGQLQRLLPVHACDTYRVRWAGAAKADVVVECPDEHGTLLTWTSPMGRSKPKSEELTVRVHNDDRPIAFPLRITDPRGSSGGFWVK